MSAKVTFKQLNPDYSQEYADSMFHGEESVDNQKANWSRTLRIDDEVSDITIKRNTAYAFPHCEVKNIAIFDYVLKGGGTHPIIVSESLISNIHFVGKSNYNKSHLYIYIKNDVKYYAPDEGLYFATDECPANLFKLPPKTI